MVDNIEARFSPQIVDRREIDKEVESCAGIILEEFHDPLQSLRSNNCGRVPLGQCDAKHVLGEGFFKQVQRDCVVRLSFGSFYSHSMAPIFHAYTKPTPTTTKNTSISANAGQPSSRKTTAHGKRKASSTSNRMNSSATR